MAFKKRMQVALEFLMIYLVILVIFLLVFMTIIVQRSSLVSNQASLSLQLIVQNIATEIGTVGSSGNGFSLALSLVPTIDNVKYSILMSNTGMVIGSMKIGGQNITAEALTNYQNLHINGTEVKSQNNIKLYSVPLINGTDLYFYNSNGSLYINERPMNYSPQGIISLKQAAAVEAATFNASRLKPSIILNNYIAPISNNFASHTISAWIYLNSYSSAPQVIYSEGTPSETLVWQILPDASLQLGIYNGAQWNFVNSSAPIPLHQWTFISGVITKVPGSTAYLVPIEYINGTIAGVESKNIETFGTNPSAHYFAIGGNVSASLKDFNGSIANLQIYNTSLSNLQIDTLYQEGISGQPLAKESLLGWFPLNGNANEYTGNINFTTADNVTYINVGELALNITSNETSKYLVSLSSVYGSMSGNGNYTSILASNNNNYFAFVTSNNSTVSPVAVSVIEPQSSISFNSLHLSYNFNNLAVWYPLSSGFGNSAYNFASQNTITNGNFNNVSWRSPMPNATSLSAPLFNSSDFIKGVINAKYLKNNAFNTNTLTISAWVDWSGLQGMQNIASIYSATNLFGIFISGSNFSAVLNNGTSTSYYSNTLNASLFENNEALITGVMNLTNNTMIIYIDGIPSKALPIYSSANLQVQDFSIGGISGGDPLGALTSFNGSISNVQIYNTSFTQQQVSNLFEEGITGSPLENTALIAWLPLDGARNDFAPSFSSTSSSSKITYKYKAPVVSNINNFNAGRFFAKAAMVKGAFCCSITSIPAYEKFWNDSVNPNPLNPANVVFNESGILNIINSSNGFGFSYSNYTKKTLGYTIPFPSTLNELNNNSVSGSGPNPFLSSYTYVYLNGTYLIKDFHNDGFVIFYRQLNQKSFFTALPLQNEIVPVGRTESSINFKPDIYEFILDWINIDGWGYIKITISKLYSPYAVLQFITSIKSYIKSQTVPGITSKITVCALVNAQQPNNAFIGGQYESFMIGIIPNASSPTGYSLNIHASTNGATTGEIAMSGGAVRLNQWSFLCGLYNGTYYKGYINGDLVINSSNHQFYTNLQNIWVGGNSFGGYSTAQIKNVQIYNTSLTQQQIAQLYLQQMQTKYINVSIGNSGLR